MQVPRRGYVPSLACARCRTIARCRHCTGPLSLQEGGAALLCRWCGRIDPTRRCARCGSDAVRAVVVGPPHRRRARPRVSGHGGDHLVGRWRRAEVAPDRPGGRHPGGRTARVRWLRAALLLDTWALLGRQDLRAAEDALWRWMSAAALVRARGDGGVVLVIAESSLPTVQSLIRWDPVGHAEAELTARAEVGLPPSVHMAAIDGTPDAVTALLGEVRLAELEADLLGPVDLPAGVRRPAG
ncbi:putative primosomal protein N priA, partial [Mycobacterium intracellulare MIN_061107_1834]